MESKKTLAMRQYDLEMPERRDFYFAGLSDSAIALRLRVQPYVITEWRQARGWPVNYVMPSSQEESNLRKRLVRAKFSDQEIAQIMKTSPQAIKVWRLRARVRSRTREMVDPANLPDSERERFWSITKNLHDFGLTNDQVARAMHSSISVIDSRFGEDVTKIIPAPSKTSQAA